MIKGREISPKMIARITGIIYLITIIAGIFSLGYVANTLIENGNPASTAANILNNKTLFEASFTVFLIEMICQLFTIVLIYMLLKPVGPKVALLALCAGLIGCTVKTVSQLFYIAPLVLLTDANYMNAFSTDQIQALALFLLNLHAQGSAIGLVFLGVFTLMSGYLMIKSTFIPKPLGFLTAIGGTGWLCFLHPPLGYSLFPLLALIGFAGVMCLIFWLLWFGIDEDKWRRISGIKI